MSPEDRRRLINLPFPTVNVETSVARHAGVTFDTIGRTIRRDHAISVQETPDDPGYFDMTVYRSMNDQDRLDAFRRQAGARNRHVYSCGRIR